MPRWRKPTKDEIRGRRAALAEKARAGALQLPGAVTEMRRALGLTQEEFARVLKLTKRQLAEIERGEANPTVDTLGRIGRLFGFGIGFVPAQAPGFVRRKLKARPGLRAAAEAQRAAAPDEEMPSAPAKP